MNRLALYRDDDLILERDLAQSAVEVGSAPSADLVIDDPAVPKRAVLVQQQAGTVWFYDLTASKLRRRVLPLDAPLRLGTRYRLVRVRRNPPPASAGADSRRRTTPLAEVDAPLCRWTVLVGRPGDRRRVTVGDQPLRVGTASSNDLVLYDPTVSAHHCRFEPEGRLLMLRDLGSTNGTYLRGVRVSRASLSTGARVRVGRTDLHVLASSERTGLGASEFVAASVAMQEALEEARRFAGLPWPVLVLGPSGVGKEELAQLLHRDGPRKAGPFVAVNAGGMPRELVESELFGHERGAFTGAVAKRRGVFEQAHGGTLFLDEIGELPLDLQARLLRVLETWKIRPVGAENDVSVDVRLVCATHRDLRAMVQAGTFRQDLYYRLARLVVSVRPLCERPEDILALARHFLRDLAPDVGERALSSEAEARLLLHDWPGNARELRNVLCAAAAMSPSATLSAEDVTSALGRVAGPVHAGKDVQALVRAVSRYGGNITAASRALSIPRTTLRDRLRRGGFRLTADGEGALPPDQSPEGDPEAGDPDAEP